jgi:ribosomal protein S4
MHKFYKHKLYRKYHDEIWGQIASSKKFSYNKKLILIKFREIVVKRRLRVKTKFKYFRRGFLKHLKNTAFTFKRSRKLLRTRLFVEKKKFRPKKFNNKCFRFCKSLFLLKLNLGLLLPKFQQPLLTVIKQSTLFFFQKNNYPFRLDNSKMQIFYKMKSFLRANNFQFSLKKKLNLRRQKVFFYSVHIAAPKKKSKKVSLFGLKNMYYKKISLFFGFKKTSQFFKASANAKKIWGKNSFGVFLALEARLSNFIFRLNLFPSVYFIKKFIQFGNVFVNNKTINYSSYVLNFNEIVSFNRKYFQYFYFYLKSNLKNKRVYLNYPNFMEVDYKLFVAMLIRNPTVVDLTKPVSFNLYTKFLTISK